MWSPWAWLTMTASMVPGIGGWRSLRVDAEVEQHAHAAVLDEVGGGAEAAAAEDGDARRRGRDRALLVLRGGEVRDGVLARLQARAGALDDLRRRPLQRRGRRRPGPRAAAQRAMAAAASSSSGVALGRRLQARRGGRPHVARRAQQVVLVHRRVALALGLRAHAASSPRATP